MKEKCFTSLAEINLLQQKFVVIFVPQKIRFFENHFGRFQIIFKISDELSQVFIIVKSRGKKSPTFMAVIYFSAFDQYQ